MFRRVTILFALLSLVLVWALPCLKTTDLNNSCDSISKLVCHETDDGNSSSAGAGTSEPNDDDTDDFAKTFDWLLSPLEVSFYLQKTGHSFERKLFYSSRSRSGLERPPRV